MKCSIESCDKSEKARGWCNAHYERWRKTGDLREDIPLVKWGSLKNKDLNGCGYRGMHSRIISEWGNAYQYNCVACGKQASDWAYNHKDPNEKQDHYGPFSENSDYYEPLCRGCHIKLDRYGSLNL